MAASSRTPKIRHGHQAAAPPADSSTSALPPLAGQCLCGDFTIVISNPRPGMIMCHCYHCQINSASFFGTYITTESRRNMMVIQSQKTKKHKPEMRVYDAQPKDAPHKCPRTFCRGCGTMLFAEPSSIGVLVVNCGLFQNHKFHPAMKPLLEIFTTRRSSWLTRREDSLQADAMPVFPSTEDDTDTEAPTSRRGSRTERRWDGAEGYDADTDEDEEDEDFENYHNDGGDHLGLGECTRSDPERRTGGEIPWGEGSRLSPSLSADGNLEDSTMMGPCAFEAVAQENGRNGEIGSLAIESRSSSGSQRPTTAVSET